MIELQQAFITLDTNNDGYISKEDLRVGLTAIHGDATDEMTEMMFSRVDKDQNGYIDYSEWVIGTIDKKDLLTRDKLWIAFNLFDEDGGGSITAQEIKDVIFKGHEQIDQVGTRIWDEIVAEVDVDGSGEIEFDEFCEMMMKLLKD